LAAEEFSHGASNHGSQRTRHTRGGNGHPYGGTSNYGSDQLAREILNRSQPFDSTPSGSPSASAGRALLSSRGDGQLATSSLESLTYGYDAG
jgi:hypothetical protein